VSTLWTGFIVARMRALSVVWLWYVRGWRPWEYVFSFGCFLGIDGGRIDVA